MSDGHLDLGHGHIGEFTRWAPDRNIPANAERYRDVEDVLHFGLTIAHPKGPKGCDCNWAPNWEVATDPTKALCIAAITFKSPTQAKVRPEGPTWDVASYEPLTVSPSILCHCGDHGFIRDGQWVPA